MRKQILTKAILESRVQIDETTGCWIYMGVNGTGVGPYPSTSNFGEQIRLHRWAYENYIGAIPDGLDIRHLCNCPFCVNPAHLLPGTHTDNMQDKVASGRQHRPIGEKNVKAKLTEEQALAILADPRKVSVIAREYGITETNIHDIRSRATWKHLGREAVQHTRHMNEKLSPDQVRAIRQDTRPYGQIANDNQVSKQTVCNIKLRRFYRDVA